MKYTVREVLSYVKDNDVKFVRLAFCDIFGAQKNMAVMASELARAFECGVGFDASAVDGFMNIERSDLLLKPDPSTLAVLPWRPSQGRVVRFYCDILHGDGAPFEGDPRRLLAETERAAQARGFTCNLGTELEFYLLEMDENGAPTLKPQDEAAYLDIAPLDKGENVRREICLSLEEMGVRPISSHHEQGPGQNEIVLGCTGVQAAADNVITCKSVMRTIAARNGLFATFMPKPFVGKSGSGMHINMSLAKDGKNVFDNPESPVMRSFIAGILKHIREITVFLNPTANSYRRLGSFEAPKYVSWSRENRSQLVRIPAAHGVDSRIEIRSPDPLCNPYFSLLMLLRAGLDGVQNNLELCAPIDANLYTAGKSILAGCEKLPETLGEAIQAARQSSFVAKCLPQPVVEKVLSVAQSHSDAWERAEDKDAFDIENCLRRV